MSTHYEERLQKDLAWIQELIGIVGTTIEDAIGNAARAVLLVDRDLASEIIIGDYLVNRQTRELDRLCHSFVARYLPSAGHLRYVSSVLRLNIALERIGDYAATISRTAVQLSCTPPAIVARDVEMMAEHARRMLHEALRGFHSRDLSVAQATLTAAAQFAHHFDKVFADLVKEGEQHSRPISDLFALMATFNRLERVIHQAKNICEETIFVGTGKMKGEKVFQILFVDERNDGLSQLAEHFTRKAFPQSGRYRSAGWKPADDVDQTYIDYAPKLGLDLSKAWPTLLVTLQDQLDDFQIVVGLGKAVREHLGKIPFHTTVLIWDVADNLGPEDAYRFLAPKLRELMEKLRGEQAC
ncbi:MAG TPA: PhoU domain-containing protein [Planctomycetota bacterium]|nr:PhoU domain-containing protein [Planctomycetota bacterium]